MKSDVIELEQEALVLMNAGKFKQAAELFSTIIEKNPDYEHGMCFYNLAGCYEDMGEFEAAEQYYRRALEYDPKDQIRLGGYASFLYLHGDPNLAFNAYLSLLRLEQSSGNKKEAEKTILALKELGRKIRLADNVLREKIER